MFTPWSWEESLVVGQFRPKGLQQLHRFLKLLVDVSVRLLSRDGDLLDGFVESVPGTDSLRVRRLAVGVIRRRTHNTEYSTLILKNTLPDISGCLRVTASRSRGTTPPRPLDIR